MINVNYKTYFYTDASLQLRVNGHGILVKKKYRNVKTTGMKILALARAHPPINFKKRDLHFGFIEEEIK